VFENMEEDIVKKMAVHSGYIRLVEQGRTPFRSTLHMTSTLLSDTLKLALTPEEEALKATLLEVVKLKDVFRPPCRTSSDTVTRLTRRRWR
jgi:hypothetical protein